MSIPEKMPAFDMPNPIALQQIQGLKEFERVSVNVKVVSVGDPIVVTGGKKNVFTFCSHTVKQAVSVASAIATS